MNSNRRSPNQFLAALSSEDFERLRPFLSDRGMVFGDVLINTSQPRVYFPHSGVISLVVRLSDGQSVEAGMIGRTSVFGASLALDGGTILNDAIVQQAGSASTINAATLRSAAEQSPFLRGLIVRHDQGVLLQAQQAAACHAFHTAEGRLSRWLLQMRELSGSDSLRLTQEFLGQMIGVRRSSVSLVANSLQDAGLIRYSRGQIELINVPGLLASSCECYSAIKKHYETLLQNDR